MTGTAITLRVYWDDQAGVELAGWYVQELRPNEFGDLEIVSDSLKVDFEVEVTDFARGQRDQLLAALAAAYPGARIVEGKESE